MNSTLELSSLIRGLLAVIGIAMALGQCPKLEHWAREQAAESIQWKRGLPHFFAGANPHRSHQQKQMIDESSKQNIR